MGLKEYRVGKLTYQYEEGHEPAGAVLVGRKAAPAVKNKARTPANKTKTPAQPPAGDAEPGEPAEGGEPSDGGAEDATDGDW